jgi:PilZ domain
MSERRNATRQKSFLRGCIYFNNRRSATECLIRDISPSGARLIFSEAVSIPDLVELDIPQKKQTLRAHVHWRHGDEVGVAFNVAERAADNELAKRVEKLEAEIATLKRFLKRLKAEALGNEEAA